MSSPSFIPTSSSSRAPRHFSSPQPDSGGALSWRQLDSTDACHKTSRRYYGEGSNVSWRRPHHSSGGRHCTRRPAANWQPTSSLNASLNASSNSAGFRPLQTNQSQFPAGVVPPPPCGRYSTAPLNRYVPPQSVQPSRDNSNNSRGVQEAPNSGVERGSSKDVACLVESVSTSVPTSPCSHPPLSPKLEGPDAVWEEAVRLMASVGAPATGGDAHYLERISEGSFGHRGLTAATQNMQPTLPPHMHAPPGLPQPLVHNATSAVLYWTRSQEPQHETISRSAIVPSTHTEQIHQNNLQCVDEQRPISSDRNVPVASNASSSSSSSKPCSQPPARPFFSGQASSEAPICSPLQLPAAASPPAAAAVAPPAAAAVAAAADLLACDQQTSAGSSMPKCDELSADYLVRAPLEVCGNGDNSSRPMLNQAICRKTLAGRIIKTIQKDRLSGCQAGLDEWRSMSSKIMQIPRHRSLMKIVEVKESTEKFFVISEKLDGGELFDYLLTEQAIPEETCKHIMRQIGTAASLLHENNLVHRDIKPENLMFRYSRNNAKLDHTAGMSSKRYRKLHELALIDFDTCKLLTSPPEVRDGRRRLVGTYGYLAPEVLKHGRYTAMSDLWSIGVILYILMTGIAPLPLESMVGSRETLAVLLRAEKQGIDFNVPPLNDFPLARDLCRQLLCFDITRRCSSTVDMLAHPWLAQSERISPVPSPLPPPALEDETSAGDSAQTKDRRATCKSVEPSPQDNWISSSPESVEMTPDEKANGDNNHCVDMAPAVPPPLPQFLASEPSDAVETRENGQEENEEESVATRPTPCGDRREGGGNSESKLGVFLQHKVEGVNEHYEQLNKYYQQFRQNAQQQGNEERRQQEIQYQEYQLHQGCLQYQQYHELRREEHQVLLQCYEAGQDSRGERRPDIIEPVASSGLSISPEQFGLSISPLPPSLGECRLLKSSDLTPSRDAISSMFPTQWSESRGAPLARDSTLTESEQISQDSSPCSCGTLVDDRYFVRGIHACGTCCTTMTQNSASVVVDAARRSLVMHARRGGKGEDSKFTEKKTER
eukprot:GHVS01081733.1.p1 GENE.GHVS01081733.1~~GHVS01081733.1.p1  ORF type:complete len:1055 (+),score=169.52 GHVS01081733.1:257-3421(+)